MTLPWKLFISKQKTNEKSQIKICKVFRIKELSLFLFGVKKNLRVPIDIVLRYRMYLLTEFLGD